MTTTDVETAPRGAAGSEISLDKAFARLKEGFAREPNPSIGERMRNLDRLEKMVLRHKDALADAARRDFGNRSKHETYIAEVFMTVEAVRYAKAHLPGWMKSERRHVALTFKPAKARVHYQPKGVVGVIAPWNYPTNLALSPMAGALAAGNRVMLKPSELTPETSALLQRIIAQTFPEDLATTITGGSAVGVEFSKLPFDHLVFTGSTHVGKLVMKAAAENLVPVTLELGGKSPTIVHESYPVAKAADTITLGKWFNCGQTCIAPDYLLVAQDRVDAMVHAIEDKVRGSYPSLRDNPDYTSVINERHHARLQAYLADARAKGAKVIEINPRNESFEGTNKIPPTLLLDVTDDMIVMQEEIFGPLLPIVPYRRVEDALRYVAERPRPLALYYFDDDAKRVDRVVKRTVSGGVCINACLLHFAQDDMPFGGVGPSGMGAYHGFEGFQTFSHAKSVFYQSKINGASLLAPPYGGTIETLLKVLLRG
jgi:coniferyl-aldehyde dehydrogenase